MHARRWTTFLVAALLAVPSLSIAADEGFESLFDGNTLTNWDGNPEFWRVEDGAITGQTTADKPTKGNTFIIWRGGEVGDFELKLEYKIVGGNSGIQYRSFEVPDNKWVIGGYQGDFEAGDTYSGINYGEKFGGILCNRGQITTVKDGEKNKAAVEVNGSVGESKEIQTKIKKEDWNTYHIIAKGFRFEHRINDTVTSICNDERKERRPTGLLALQLHAGPPMKVQFRNIRIKKLASAPAQSSTSPSGAVKKIALIAGKQSHGYGAHEHRAGCMLLAKALNESGLPVKAEVYGPGWPEDARVLQDAATIVIYADGGGGHPFNAHIDELNALTKKGVGIVCVHYGVEVPAGPSGDAFLDWTGGYFEANWSVNPHWTAEYGKFPEHPITRGVKPFAVNDEWYYHMRFRSGMDGVTPILSALPPPETLSRKDGPHSGNPAVREAVARGETQHMAWARQRPDGGRGFGFTGGHDHWNWGNNDFRKLVLNAIVWTAGVEVPADGVPSKSLTVDDLLANLDKKPIPPAFNPAGIQKMLEAWNGK